MSNQEEIAALREEIKQKERQVYQANKDMNAWNKGMSRSHANAKMTQLFVETQRKEIAEMGVRLRRMEKEK